MNYDKYDIGFANHDILAYVGEYYSSLSVGWCPYFRIYLLSDRLIIVIHHNPYQIVLTKEPQ